MAKASPSFRAFNAGEWTPRLDGRTDLVGYDASSRTLENWRPTIQGPIERRAATEYNRPVKNMADRTWMVPFRRSRQISYQVEFGDQYCRFYFNRGCVLTGSPAAITGVSQANRVIITTSAPHGYSDGDDVFLTDIVGPYQLNNRWYKIDAATSTTFEIRTVLDRDVSSLDLDAYVSGGEADIPYEITSPYALADLTTDEGECALDFTQSLDVLYITQRGRLYAPRKLVRTSSTSWAFETFEPEGGPFQPLNSSATTIYASAATGSVTLTASTAVFTSDLIGSLIRVEQEIVDTSVWITGTSTVIGDYRRSNGKEYLAVKTETTSSNPPSHTFGVVSDGAVEWEYTSPGYGIARITAVAGDNLSATATVLTTFPQTLIGSANASTLWRLGAWSDALGWPSSVGFYRERLAFLGGDRYDLSAVNDFENFAIDDAGEILATNAISGTVQSGQANEITGIVEGPTRRSAAILTEGGEFILGSLSEQQAFGPGNSQVTPTTQAFGSRPIKPLAIGEAAVHVQASGTRVREMTYDIQVDTTISRDLMVRAKHLGDTHRIIQTAFQAVPEPSLFALREDGVLLMLTYDRTQEVRGWAPWRAGGTDALIEAISVISSPDGTRDDLWCIVSRTIDGATRRYVEIFAPEFLDGQAANEARYVDSFSVYEGDPASTIYGLDHLHGETLRLAVDGAEHIDKTASGAVELERSGSVVVGGLAYRSRYQSFRIEAGAIEGTSQGKTKRLTDNVLRVENTLGGEIGPDFENLQPVSELNSRAPTTPMNTGTPLYSGDARPDEWPGGYETDGRICYENDTIFPATIIGIYPQVVTSEMR